VRKRGVDTPRVATALAALAGVPAVGVGYSGLKDRHAVTTQWLSVDLAGRPEPDWAALGVGGVEVLAAHRHDRKLRRGAHRANRFELTLREVAGDRVGLEARLSRVGEAGVPNYFGEQRFGRGGGNPAKAIALLRGEVRVRDRGERGLLLSAARAVLFNRVLAARVAAGTWDRALPGEVLMLDGRHSWFVADEVTAELRARVERGEVHPTGALWGRGEPPSQGEARAEEAAALAGCEAWCEGLERAGLDQDRRALRVVPRDLAWDPLGEGVLRLRLTLPAGAYATAVLREVVG
jgi:tRNA pseudouridine13 synthase